MDRPWNTAVAFDPSSEEGNRIIVGTGSYKVRLYDSKAGKRPQKEFAFKDFRITSISPESDGNRWWIGDAGGNLQVYDVKAGAFHGAIKGIGGSVRSTDIHPSLPYIVSVGLDRFLRINHIRSRQSIAKVYLKSQSTAVQCVHPISKPTDAGAEHHEEDVAKRSREEEGRRQDKTKSKRRM